MAGIALQNEIMEAIASLPTDRQRNVLQFVRTLKDGIPVPNSPGALHRFAGSIDQADLQQMAAAIEAECEKVGPGEW